MSIKSDSFLSPKKKKTKKPVKFNPLIGVIVFAVIFVLVLVLMPSEVQNTISPEDAFNVGADMKELMEENDTREAVSINSTVITVTDLKVAMRNLDLNNWKLSQEAKESHCLQLLITEKLLLLEFEKRGLKLDEEELARRIKEYKDTQTTAVKNNPDTSEPFTRYLAGLGYTLETFFDSDFAISSITTEYKLELAKLAICKELGLSKIRDTQVTRYLNDRLKDGTYKITKNGETLKDDYGSVLPTPEATPVVTPTVTPTPAA
ncbi:MAG: hypothetical protein E7315_00035 [Clostridiales bacterium]|nr:hypothetical protein [Clostridiales bacterium]